MNNDRAFSNAFVKSSGESDVLEPGDVALVLKKNGEVQGMTFGYDRSRLAIPVEDQTEEDKHMLAQGQKLFALSLAASNPTLMSVLMAIASDPDVIDMEKLKASTRLN